MKSKFCCCHEDYQKTFISIYPAGGGERIERLYICPLESIELAIEQLIQTTGLTGEFAVTIASIGSTPKLMHFTAKQVIVNFS
jgi:hypothetical protein